MPDVANVRSDTWKVSIGGAELEFNTTVTLGGGYDLAPIRSQKTGTDIIASMVQGRAFQLSFEIEETLAAVLQRALGLTAAGDGLAVGAQLPTHEVLLHPADVPDATTTDDIGLYALSFGRLERTADGQGPGMWKLTGEAQRDASGKVFWLGAKPA